jgi:hypothetical protein
MYKEGMNNSEYNANIINKQTTIDNISSLRDNIIKKDYSIYNTETSAMYTQQWNFFIILSIVTLSILAVTLKYVIS